MTENTKILAIAYWEFNNQFLMFVPGGMGVEILMIIFDASKFKTNHKISLNYKRKNNLFFKMDKFTIKRLHCSFHSISFYK